MTKTIEDSGQIFMEAPEDGAWFLFFTSSKDQDSEVIKYDDPVPGGAEFCIRSTKKFYTEQLKTRKYENSIVVNPKTRGMEKVTSFKEQTPAEIIADYEDAIDYAITGIRNAFWEDKSPIQCTKEEKLRLKNIAVFDRFFLRVIEILDEGEIRQIAAAEKNSSTP